MSGGVVRASTIEIKSTAVVINPPPPPPSSGSEFEVKALVTGFVSVSNFMLSGTRIDASAATFERGTAADLRNGVQIEVKGVLTAGVVKASRVRFER